MSTTTVGLRLRATANTNNNTFFDIGLPLLLSDGMVGATIANTTITNCSTTTGACVRTTWFGTTFQNIYVSGTGKYLFQIDSIDSSNFWTVNNNLIQDAIFINTSTMTSAVFSSVSNTDGQALNNTFLNATYYNETLTANSNLNEIYRKWYYQARAIDTLGNGVNGATISIWNVSMGNPVTTLTTGANGFTSRANLISYWRNSTDRTSQNNYTINASYVGNAVQNRSYNLTYSNNVFDTFTFFVPYSNLSVIYPLSRIIYVKLNQTVTNLYVLGNASIGQNLYVGGNTNLSGNVVIGGNFSSKRAYYYGYDNSTQPFLNTANAQVMNISNNNDYKAWQIAVEQQQNLTFQTTGEYLISLSPEFFQSGGGSALATFYMQKTNSTGYFVDVPWSNSRFTVPNNAYNAPTIEFAVEISNTSQKVRFMWWSDSTSTLLYSSGALTSPTRPSIPAVIINVRKSSALTP